MDLLASPDDPAFPSDRAPFVCSKLEQWDGQQFLTYALRKGKLRAIPLSVRHWATEASKSGSEDEERGDTSQGSEPYLELYFPTPKEEQEPFFQTWFFFGLLAEFLDLNEPPPGGQRLEDAEWTKSALGFLYSELVTTDKSGQMYINGAKAVSIGPRIINRLLKQIRSTDAAQARLGHLRRCLEFVYIMINQAHSNDFNNLLRLSIAALGEFLSMVINTMIRLDSVRPLLEMSPVALPWQTGFFTPGSDMEGRMLKLGWCKSEVERMRNSLKGLNTMHYMSQLKRRGMQREHSACTLNACNAATIDPDGYKPTHAGKNCSCPLFEVDLQAVLDILHNTDSFPVLRIVQEREDTTVAVERYEPNTPYIALSHVWAEGLGNPEKNAIHTCQIAALAGRLQSLQREEKSFSVQDEPSTSISEDTCGSTVNLSEPYRLWIDTLLCPIELTSKIIALDRIRDVYLNARHVLVLDSTLIEYSTKEMQATEGLLRIFGLSGWMRRLWTLQEGALARSLCIQLADCVVNPFKLLIKLFEDARLDMRYLKIYDDMVVEFNHLHGFFPQNMRASYSGDITWERAELTTLQHTLFYRSVTMPDDEALCIAALMSLPIGTVARHHGADERMKSMWALLADEKHGIPARVIFFVDNPLPQKGWRWAPRSLLGRGSENSAWGISERMMRFGRRELGEAAMSVLHQSTAAGPLTAGGRIRGFDPERVPQLQTGLPTPRGFRVRFPGARMVPQPRKPGFPLHPWQRLLRPTMQTIYVQETLGDGSTAWFRLLDAYRSLQARFWTDEQLSEYDRKERWPMCKAIDTGKCALIYNWSTDPGEPYHGYGLLVQIETEEEVKDQNDEIGLFVRSGMPVHVVPLTPEEVTVAETVRELADALASDPVTKHLLEVDKAKGHDSPDYKSALSEMRKRMNVLMLERWDAHPAFAKAVHDTIGPDMRDYMSVTIAQRFSHDVKLVGLPKDQLWLVD